MNDGIDQWLQARADLNDRRKGILAEFLGCMVEDWYGMLPFAPVRDADGKWWVAAAVLPPPVVFGDHDTVIEDFGDGAEIERVVTPASRSATSSGSTRRRATATRRAR